MSLTRSLLRINRLMYAQASGISAFFNEISRLIDEAERQYGLANRSHGVYTRACTQDNTQLHIAVSNEDRPHQSYLP